MEISIEKVIGVINGVISPLFITLEMGDVDLDSVGIDSIYFIELAVALETAFGITIPNERLIVEELNTPNKIVRVLLEICQSANKNLQQGHVDLNNTTSEISAMLATIE